MPSPRRDEDKQDFINRCVEELITQENREPDQARAICETYWTEGKISEALEDKLTRE